MTLGEALMATKNAGYDGIWRPDMGAWAFIDVAEHKPRLHHHCDGKRVIGSSLPISLTFAEMIASDWRPFKIPTGEQS